MARIGKYFQERTVSKPVTLRFYLVIEKKGKVLLKPMKELDTKAPMQIIKGVLENTITENFYAQLINDLKNRGVKQGSKIQVRAVFDEEHKQISPDFKGMIKLCEVEIK
ncbi:MAG: hypothetical protein ABII22_06270 [Candidatus Micrarchaeota archaeon]